MSPEVAPICLRAEDALELAELLEFLGQLVDHTPDVLAEILAGFCGSGYTLGELRDDLARFAFLLGGDGERFVFGDNR